MKKKEVNLESIFQEQKKKENLATIEQIENDNENVKITPWDIDNGCLCDLSIIISKDSLSKIYQTEYTHKCCGKNLIVVEIEFKSDYMVKISSIIEQQFDKLSKKSDGKSTNHNLLNNFEYPDLDHYNSGYEYPNQNNVNFHNCPRGLIHKVCNGKHYCVTYNSRGYCCGKDGRKWCEPAF